MHQISIVIFREFLEISLLIGLFSSIGSKIKNFKMMLSAGILCGIVGASLLAFFTEQISNSLDGVGSEIFDAIILLFTSLLICVTLVWMKQQTSKISAKMTSISENIDPDLYSKIIFTLLIGVSIFREGAEIVLILHSFYAIAREDSIHYLQGLALGALMGITCGLALFLGLFKFATRYVFAITSFFMTFVAAGLAAEAGKILASVAVIDNFGSVMWDTSDYISDESAIGKLLKIIVGYTSRPSGIELIFYITTILLIVISEKVFTGKRS